MLSNHIKTLAVKPSLISRRECGALRTGTPGRPQFYVSAETLEDLLGLGFSMGKISRMFGVSRWTIYRRIQSYGLQNTVQFSLLSDAELDELVLEYMGRHGFTTGRTYLAGYLQSVGLRVQRRRFRRLSSISLATNGGRSFG